MVAALARVHYRLAADESSVFFRCGVYFRFNATSLADLAADYGVPRLIMWYIRRNFRNNLHGQGMGRHKEEDVRWMMHKCMKTFTAKLGERNVRAVELHLRLQCISFVSCLLIKTVNEKSAADVNSCCMTGWKTTVGLILGDKRFLFGDTATEADCALFGLLAVAKYQCKGELQDRVNGTTKASPYIICSDRRTLNAKIRTCFKKKFCISFGR